MNLEEIYYEKYGSLSKLALEILCESKSYPNIHDLCYKLGISYKFIKDVLLDFENLKSNVNSLPKIEKTNISTNLTIKIQNIISKFKNHNKNLDHVSAIPETLNKRANYLFSHHDLKNCKLLFLGDHDFTSLATALLLKELNIDNYEITVLDIDESVLEFIYNTSNKYNLNIKILYSDFRVGIPISCLHHFDIIFSDPPYTPEGMALFLNNAIDCAKDKYSTIYLCYKTAELSPAIGYKVQQELLKSHIYFKEIISNFNTYNKAEALGYRSDLYVCSILPKAFEKIKNTNIYDIYTHGHNSLEATNTKIISFDEVVKNISLLDNCQNCIKVISNLKKEKVDFVSMNVYYKQKSMKNINHPRNCSYVIDFSYQNKDVLSLRTLIMSDKDEQFGVFINNQYSNIKNWITQNLYEMKKIYSNDFYSIIKFSLKKDIKNSLLSIFLYKNSNLKNAFVNISSNLMSITQNQAREIFNNSPIANYAENYIYDLPICLLQQLYNFIDSLKPTTNFNLNDIEN